MKLELIFEGNTITEYLDKLQRAVNDNRRREKALKDSADDVVELIDEYVPIASRNLLNSGHLEGFRKYSHSTENSDITILYTGFTGEGRSAPENIHIWDEFAKGRKGGIGAVLERDYAFYQETGIDEIAAPFGGHHYVESGIENSWDMIEWRIGEYLERVISLK